MNWLVLILLLFLGTFAYAGRSGAPWFPTWGQDIKRFLDLVQIKPGQKFYDLGCGDGKLVFAAANQGAIATGFEISLLPYLIAKIHSFSVKNSVIKFSNFWNKDISDADIVYVFLTPKVNPKVKQKLEKELRNGSKVIAYTWPIDGWDPIKIDRVPGQPSFYLYIIQ